MNYYFTADKWYGPLPEGILPQYVTPSLFSLIESLPSGDSKIPQFAGMVKEEGKDFVLRWGIDTSSYQGESCTYFDTEKEAMDKYYEWSKYDGNLQCMTKKPQLYAAPIKTAVPVAEEGKQTFSEDDMIGFAYWVYRHCDYVCDANGREDTWGWETDTKDGFFSNNELLTEYLKTKQ